MPCYSDAAEEFSPSSSLKILEITRVNNFRSLSPHIRVCLAHLESPVNSAVLEECAFTRIKRGLRFLDELHQLSTNRHLVERIQHLVDDFVQQLRSSTKYNDEIRHSINFRRMKRKLLLLTGRTKRIQNRSLDHLYVDLQRKMNLVIFKQGTNEYDSIFPYTPRKQETNLYRVISVKTNDFISKSIRKVMNTIQVGPLMKELKKIQKIMIYLKPLVEYAAGRSLEWPDEETMEKCLFPLHNVHDKAARIVYSILFDIKMDVEEDMLPNGKDMKEMYLVLLTASMPVMPQVSQLGILAHELLPLSNLIELLQCNATSHHDAAPSMLFTKLLNFRDFLGHLPENLLQRRLPYLEASIDSLLHKSIPILYSCHAHMTKKMATDLNVKLSDALDWIKDVKINTLEIKLSKYPRTDGLGFLIFFLEYMEGLLKYQQALSIENEIRVLHSEVQTLVSTLITIHIQPDDALWTHIVYLAYQAEYLIHIFLLCPSTPPANLISFLSDVVEEMMSLMERMHTLHRGEYLSADQDGARTTTSIHVLGTTILENDLFVGLKKDSSTILEYLVGGGGELDVITIVGMAGVGKTTLAMRIYNTFSSRHHFDIQAWCIVSQSYKKRDLIFKILEQVDVLPEDVGRLDDDDLADYLCRSLKQGRYLIIIDDMWDVDVWNYLKLYLPNNKQGSRILITTRQNNVASEIKSKVHVLSGLTQDESWDLLKKKLQQRHTFPESLLRIAKQIAESCKGLPLSIVIIAGLLSDTEKDEHRWQQIAESVTSHIFADPEGKCRAILEFSYNHLPDYLRSCFLYFAAFPEDTEIQVSWLKRLWIAEGFIRETEAKSFEDAAEECIVELVVRNLVIPVEERSKGRVMSCRMHDLLRDFCIKRAMEEDFLVVANHRNCSFSSQDSFINYSVLIEDPCRLSVTTNLTPVLELSNYGLRSLLLFPSVLLNEGTDSMLLLRVLDVAACYSLSSDISLLIHLRYLAVWRIFSWSSFELSSVSKLRNLQTLILTYEEDIVEVPDSLWGLGKLMHLHIRPCALFQIDTYGVQQTSVLLPDLRSLSKPRLRYDCLELLGKFPKLRELSCIVDSWNDHCSLNCTQFPELNFFNQLTSLEVKYESREWDPDKRQYCCIWNRRKRCKLHFPKSLRELSLTNFFLLSEDISEIGRMLPDLELLNLYDCGLWDYGEVSEPWSVNDEDFPRLKVLILTNLQFYEWNASEYSFDCLEQLILESCDYIEEIPPRFGDIPSLRLVSLRNCKPSVDDSAREIEEIQREAQNEELRVDIYPKKWKQMEVPCSRSFSLSYANISSIASDNEEDLYGSADEQFSGMYQLSSLTDKLHIADEES